MHNQIDKKACFHRYSSGVLWWNNIFAWHLQKGLKLRVTRAVEMTKDPPKNRQGPGHDDDLKTRLRIFPACLCCRCHHNWHWQVVAYAVPICLSKV